IVWSVDPQGALAIKWEELGGPAVQAPTRTGFGSSIVERAIPFELEGEARVDFALSGVRAHFKLPARYFVTVDGTDAVEQNDPSEVQETGPVDRGSVLLVEDNVIIAMDAEIILNELGFSEVVVVRDTNAAMRHLERRTVDYAVLDINLGNETSFGLAAHLRDLGIPLTFASGYGDQRILPEDLRNVPIVTKPYTEPRFREVMDHQ
ncbi:MAG: response regulator, partial [Pseudomonadota bacterium]